MKKQKNCTLFDQSKPTTLKLFLYRIEVLLINIAVLVKNKTEKNGLN